MKKQLFLFLLLAASIFFIGCSGSEDDGDVTQLGKIVGSVNDTSTGECIYGAHVKLSKLGKSVVTGSDGLFYFQEVPAGDYEITVTKDDYESTTANVTVRANKQSDVHLNIKRQGGTLIVNPDLLDFGEKETTLSFTVVNKHYADLAFKVEKGDCKWLSVNPEADILAYGKTATIVVKLDRDLLANGENNTTLVVRSTNGSGNAEVKVKAIGEYRAEATVNTEKVSDVTETSIKFNAEVTNVGTPKYTERGFVWGTNTNPTMENKLQSEAVTINENPKYSLVVKSLKANTNYYVRAYLKQNNKYIYGNSVAFSTNQQQTELVTSNATDITMTSAVLNGAIIKAGNPTYTEKGFCYETSYTPSINSIKIIVSDPKEGNYKATLSGLKPNTYYMYRAYAIQDGKAVYGETISFRTADISKASVNTNNITINGYGSLTLNGDVTSAGNPAITERGFCYSESYYPSISDTKIRVAGTSTGTYKYDLNNVQEGIDLYVRAYVIQDGKPIYGDTKSVETPYKPQVQTGTANKVSEVSGSSYWQATLIGRFLNGDPDVTEIGFVYGNYSNPTVNGSNSYTIQGSIYSQDGEIYYYNRTIKNLSAYKTYYFRAYVKTKYGYFYGATETFTTY